MGKKNKDKLLLNLLESEKYRHRVAMVTDEGAFNQHEPNSNMARMFVIMLLIHVVVIGGIIVYDFINGEEAAPTELTQDFTQPQQAKSALAPNDVGVALEPGKTLDEYSTYDWKSGDSIRSVARKLEVSEEVLIKLNKLDQGRQINTNDVIIYPKRPVLRAVGVSVAGANGELAKPVPAEASIAAAEVPINLTMPGETGFSFSATIEDELTPAPNVAAVTTPAALVQDSPPPAVNTEASGETVRVELPVTAAAPMKVEEAPPAPVVEPAPAPAPAPKVEKEVPKAIPVTRDMVENKQPAPAPEKPAVKKVQEAPPAPVKKETPKTSGSTYTVQSGDTLYRIANRNGVSVKALQDANKISRPEALKIGMKLVIPRR